MADNIVGGIMTRDVVCFNQEDSIIKIAREMKKRNISGVLIKRGSTPIGVITERDMTGRVVADERDLISTKAKDIMSSPIYSIPPETNVLYASQLMKKSGFKRFPVIKNGKLVGIITQSDIIRFFNEQKKQFVIDSLKNSSG